MLDGGFKEEYAVNAADARESEVDKRSQQKIHKKDKIIQNLSQLLFKGELSI